MPRPAPWITALLIAFALAAPVAAQEAAAPAEAAAAPAEAAPAPESGDAPAEKPAFDPALTDPATEPAEFQLRLIPLTVAELEKLAADWLGIVQAKTAQVVQEQILINRLPEGDITDDVRAQLTAITEERRALFDNYTSVIDAWELKGGDPEAIKAYRAYRSSIIVEETRNTDWRTLLSQAVAWTTARDGGVQVAINVATVAAAFVGLLIVARLVRSMVRRWIGHIPNLSKLLQSFLVMAIYWLTLAVGLMVVLAALGVNVTPLFALVGGASFILAFAMQNTLGNLAAGLMIMINRPFDEGDYVAVGGVSGTVRNVSIVSTTVVTPDNQIVVVPNSSVWGNVITNATASETRRVDLVFGVPIDASIEKTQGVLEETVRANPLVLAEPEPIVRVNELSDSTVKFVVRPWTRSGDYWTVYWDLTRKVKENLQRAGIVGSALPEDAA